MEQRYLMGNNDNLWRSVSNASEPTFINDRLRTRLFKASMAQAFKFYFEFFEKSSPNLDYDDLAKEYEQAYLQALSLGLFKPGSICEKDHLNFWCLGRAFLPEVYIESGVFIGGSLHAFIDSPGLKSVIGIDPNLNNLRVPVTNTPKVSLIDDRDFSQLKIDNPDARTLTYFDDHINTADRILQSTRKRLTYLLFDDSSGLEGICQRLYPAIPTIPMIIHCDLLSVGDELCWTYAKPSSRSLKPITERTILRVNNGEKIRIVLTVTKDLIDKCHQAREQIKKYSKLPDLGDFIPQRHPEKTVDAGKFLIQLK